MLGVAALSITIRGAAQGDPVLAWLGFLVAIVLCFILVVNRLRNIGISGWWSLLWWSLLILVPVANLLVAICCLMYPEGYQHTEKLDTAGKVLFWGGIFIGLAVLLACLRLAWFWYLG